MDGRRPAGREADREQNPAYSSTRLPHSSPPVSAGSAAHSAAGRAIPYSSATSRAGRSRRGAAAVVLTGTLVAVPAVLLLGGRDRTGSGPGADDVRAPR